MIKKLFYILSTFSIFICFSSTFVVSAQSYIWLAQDPIKAQGLNAELMSDARNWLNVWIYNSSSIEYEVSSSSLINAANSAAANWTSKIPQIKWTNNLPTGSVQIVESSTLNCPGSSAAAGCMMVTAYSGDFTAQQAKYIIDARIEVKPNFTESQKQQIIAHEMGHVIGLHEGYITNGNSISCGTRNTIMNAVGCNTLTGPSNDDKTEVQNMLGGYVGSATDVSGSWLNGVFNLKFKDNCLLHTKSAEYCSVKMLK